MRTILCVIGLLFVSGCATKKKLNDLEVGMSKQEVINIMGAPDSTSSELKTEYLNYLLYESEYYEPGFILRALLGARSDYFVRLVDGRVEAFGKKGDFNSTNPATIRIETKEVRD